MAALNIFVPAISSGVKPPSSFGDVREAREETLCAFFFGFWLILVFALNWIKTDGKIPRDFLNPISLAAIR